jgi:hypothetical protein
MNVECVFLQVDQPQLSFHRDVPLEHEERYS